MVDSVPRKEELIGLMRAACRKKNFMKIKMTFFILFLAGMFFCPHAGAQYVSETRYDYSKVAARITSGCETKYEQAEAIYKWLCANISYDVSYRVHTADECWDKRTGVCQAYCELFYRIAEPLGLKTYIISGTSKTLANADGRHSWIFVVTSGENSGIFIDPTWGAGSVSGNTFIRNDNDMSWFHVSPYWLIFTHFPEDESCQLLDNPISRAEFDRLPVVDPIWEEYGLDAREVFAYYRGHSGDAPVFYDEALGKVRILDVPLDGELRVGNVYHFELQKIEPCELGVSNSGAVIAEGRNAFLSEWVSSGSRCLLDFIPSKAGDLNLWVVKDGVYQAIVGYKVAEPTRDDMAKLEQIAPLAMPEISCLENADTRIMHEIGVDGKRLLSMVRSGGVTSLPVFYNPEMDYKVVDIPFNGVLYRNREYVFSVQAGPGMRWAIINGNDWYRDWRIDPESGVATISLVPRHTGRLVLAVNDGSGTSFSYCIAYEVR